LATKTRAFDEILELPEERQNFQEMEGGIPSIAPGTTKEMTIQLEPGRYSLVCFVPTSEGTQHWFEGMYQELEVA
jgi:hypothetical protein